MEGPTSPELMGVERKWRLPQVEQGSSPCSSDEEASLWGWHSARVRAHSPVTTCRALYDQAPDLTDLRSYSCLLTAPQTLKAPSCPPASAIAAPSAGTFSRLTTGSLSPHLGSNITVSERLPQQHYLEFQTSPPLPAPTSLPLLLSTSGHRVESVLS